MTEPLRQEPALLQAEQVDGLVAAAGVEGALAILDAFHRSTVDLLGVMGEDLRQSALSEASRSAHAVKGSAANVGAQALAESASAIEIACKNGQDAFALAKLEEAHSLFEAFCEAFRSHLQQP